MGGRGSAATAARVAASQGQLDEETVDFSYDPKLFRRFISVAFPFWRWILLAVVFAIGVACIEIAGPLLVRHIINVPVKNGDFDAIRNYSLIFLGLELLVFVLTAALVLVVNWTGQSVMLVMRQRIFRHLQTLDVKFFDRNPVGRLLTRVMNDVAALNDAMTMGIPAVFRDVFILAGIVIVLFWVDWRLTLAIFPIFPIILGAGWVFSRVVRKYYRLTRLRLSGLNAFLQENLSGMRIVQLFGREKSQHDKFVHRNRRYRDANLGTVFSFSIFFPTIELVQFLGLALLIWYGGGQLIQNALTPGDMFLFLLLIRRFFNPIRQLAEQFNTFEAAMAASERIFNLLDTKPDLNDPENPVEPQPFTSGIEFDGVWFAYNEDEWVLKDVNFTVPRGKTVAIVGSTGAGKTTIINLLQRFHDVQKGRIRVDGVDIRNMAQRDLRRRMAVVLQDIFLFQGSIGDNIKLGNPGMDDEGMHSAARTVHADTFIERYEEGYDHEILERGATLSVGQKQLLAFARALATEPELLILDEATSNIDTETERLIQDAMDRLLKGRTAIVIAHRLSTIKRADKIIVMHHGRKHEEGTHEELMAHGGIYWRLCQMQYKDELNGNGQNAAD